MQHCFDLFRLQRLQKQDLATREERRVDGKRGVFRGRANQGEQAAFHMGQKGVLLAFVEAVDLIDKEDGGALLRIPQCLGLFHNLPDFLDPGKHGGKEHKVR